MQPTLDLDTPELETLPQRVIVTAGASGLGLTIATAFSEVGARVHIGDASARSLAEALGDHPGIHGTVADVAVPDDVDTMFREALEWMGGLDVLVNCAAIGGPRAAIEHVEAEEWERTLRVNLSGAFFCIRQASSIFRAQQSGSIVNVASTSARTGLPMRTPFVASMAGVLGLTANCARELGPDNVRCNAVLPGVLEDEQARELVEARARERQQSAEEAEAEFLSHISMRSWIDSTEVADAVIFLASDRARHITGQTLGVCGNVEWEG